MIWCYLEIGNHVDKNHCDFSLSIGLMDSNKFKKANFYALHQPIIYIIFMFDLMASLFFIFATISDSNIKAP